MTETSEACGHRTVTDAAIQRFGALTGDYAQMHFDLDFGPAHGMGGTIAHGLLSGAWSLGALAQHAPERLAIGDAQAFVAGFDVRFQRSLFLGDLFSLRWRDADAPAVEGIAEADRLDTAFEVVNQKGEVATSGHVSVVRAGGSLPPSPEPLEIGLWSKADGAGPIHADDMVDSGPRGESLGRTVTEADLVAWTGFTGDLDPAYLNAPFAETGRFGGRIAPPMWTFCLGFGDFLRDLLSVSMPSTGFAGHLGDWWRFLAPVHVGDTIRTRHRPIAWKPSASRPDMGIVEFGLQVVNQRDEIVQDGRVVMMMGARPKASVDG
ncbi:MAG: MaoC/PaaZ C-terminal domain-containing protein [Myxococcota bacterium]